MVSKPSTMTDIAILRHAILPRESRRAFPRKSHHIGSVSPFTARAFRFTPTRRAKIRAGMTPLVRALPKRSRGDPVRTPRRERKSVGQGKRVSGSVDKGGRGIIKIKQNQT